MRWLVTGASGYLGNYLLKYLRWRGGSVIAWSESRRDETFDIPFRPVPLWDVDRVVVAFREARPDLILHAAAMARVDDCFRDPVRAAKVNALGTALLAELADRTGARLILVSTDLVFDGERGHYREDDLPNPLSVYGRTKADAESAVLANATNAVARVSLLFGPSMSARPSFFDATVEALRSGQPVTLFADEWRTPVAVSSVAEALIGLAQSDVTGLLHLGGPERLSRMEMGCQLAEHLGVSPAPIVAARRADAPSSEPRPRDTSLDSSRWRALFPEFLPWRTYREALAEILRVRR